jgi:GDSL-like Lipase/Acylhydrolase family
VIRWRGLLRRDARPAARQQVFGFQWRSWRRRRAFKAAILATTALAVALIIAGSPTGRHGVLVASNRARSAVRWTVGLPSPREEVEAERQDARWIGVERTRAALAATLDREPPGMLRLLRVARMEPETAVIRWGNFDGTFVLSSGVFEPDDAGRSYRFKPNTRSIWLIGLTLRDAMCQFQIPDTPEAREAGAAASGVVVPESVQTTNSWGCRGPEPDTKAPLRGIVLGDSVIQGALVGDDQTPPACLERELATRTGLRTSVLNTGVLGYSTEQYYYTLERFFPRMSPRFVVVGLCGNDFGDWGVPENWDEACYWLERILEFCQHREIVCLVVAWPGEDSLLSFRDDSVYPGQVSRRLRLAGVHYLYPIEAFTDEDLRLRTRWELEGKPSNISALYNRHLMGDNHMSPRGCALWGKVVAERLEGIMRRKALYRPGGLAAGR